MYVKERDREREGGEGEDAPSYRINGDFPLRRRIIFRITRGHSLSLSLRISFSPTSYNLNIVTASLPFPSISRSRELLANKSANPSCTGAHGGTEEKTTRNAARENKGKGKKSRAKLRRRSCFPSRHSASSPPPSLCHGGKSSSFPLVASYRLQHGRKYSISQARKG